MLGTTLRQPRHCRHTLVAFALTAVAEMMMPWTLTRRDTCSDCGGDTVSETPDRGGVAPPQRRVQVP